MKKKICSKCKIEKDVCEYNKKSVNNKGVQYYKSRCKECQSEDEKIKRDKNVDKYKSWYDKTRDTRNKWRSEYYRKNKEKILTQNKKQIDKNNITRNKRYHENPIVKLRHRISCRLRESLKFKSLIKNKTYDEIIGCTPEFLIQHIERQFTEGMSWENHGLYGWHIDHIIPLSSAKTEEEIYKLSHYTNLQPLWSEDNLKKGGKILS
jgi:hypothetical protein